MILRNQPIQQPTTPQSVQAQPTAQSPVLARWLREAHQAAMTPTPVATPSRTVGYSDTEATRSSRPTDESSRASKPRYSYD